MEPECDSCGIILLQNVTAKLQCLQNEKCVTAPQFCHAAVLSFGH